MTVEDLHQIASEHGCKPRRNARGGFKCLCPCCQIDGAPHSPGCSVDRGDNGTVLLHCFRDCRPEAILEAWGRAWGDVLPERPEASGNGAKSFVEGVEVARWTYHDAEGAPLFDVVRIEPGRKKPKDYRQVPHGQAQGNIKHVPRPLPLYRLPDVLAAVRDGWTIYLVEGEKCADAVNACPDADRLLATTNPGGSSAWGQVATSALQGAHQVVVWQDKDKPGQTWARAVVASLDALGVPSRLVESRYAHDAADHLAAGHALEDVAGVGEAKDAALRCIDLATLYDTEMEPVRWAVDGLLVEKDLAVIGGEPGSGKSMVLLDLAISMAAGKPFLGSIETGEACSVLYLDEENHEALARRRLGLLLRGAGLTRDDLQGLRLVYGVANALNLDTGNMDPLHRLVDQVRPAWILLDSLIRFHSRDENSNSAMAQFFAEKIRPLMARCGSGLIGLHHLAKPSKERSKEVGHRLRGASDIRAMVDQLWGIEGDSKTRRRTLTHEKCRWGEPAPDLAIEYHETEDSARLTSASESHTSHEIVRSIIVESDGISRQAIIAALAEEGLKHPERAASRALAALKQEGRVVSETVVTETGKVSIYRWRDEK